MHEFLRNVGFSNISTEEELSGLLDELQEKYMHTAKAITRRNGETMITVRAEIADRMGICIRGYVFSDGKFHRTYYSPYVYNDVKSVKSPSTPFEITSGGNFMSVVRDGLSQMDIWFVNDNIDDLGELVDCDEPDLLTKSQASLAAFADFARVLLPVDEKEKVPADDKQSLQKHEELMSGVRNGDIQALEALATADLGRLAIVSRRLEHEDIYSIVDGCFVPHGIECVDYELIGDITEVIETENVMTGEKLYRFRVGYSNLDFVIAVNAKDVHGEPKVGRRLKCPIWLTGRIHLAK